ncbi:MAG: hypothetical protein A2288_00470 [Candidatus Moranbacteria bacterium RIFOXYA12_FULL_44_15]|nr:MAG: hypothetical protein A2288_00470 [Candidatus Moranbacteria bacterium RIFOXYA12_FULL_44_15]
MRKTDFVNDEYYHIYNRGVDKREIFLCNDDYKRFVCSMRDFNALDPIGSIFEKRMRERKGVKSFGRGTSKLVEILCYCLNPNHYHFILRQLSERGVEKFMKRLGNGYTKYFNHRYDRSGVLFQGSFRSVYIENNEQLLHLSAYINANHFIHGFEKELPSKSNYLYSSSGLFLKKQKNDVCDPIEIVNQFDAGTDEYKNFLDVNAQFFKEKKEVERDHYMLE